MNRKVSFFLQVGIFFLPMVFSWFLLRNGYSKRARAIAFSWLAFTLMVGLLGNEGVIYDTFITILSLGVFIIPIIAVVKLFLRVKNGATEKTADRNAKQPETFVSSQTSHVNLSHQSNKPEDNSVTSASWSGSYSKAEEAMISGLIEFKETMALKQFEKLREKFGVFLNILNHQFDNDEMTHGRYLNSTEQLYLGVVDKLQRYVLLRRSVSGIDLDYINERLQDQHLHEDSRNALVERLTLHKNALTEMDGILAINEQVMTRIDIVTSSLGAIQTREGAGGMDLETALQEIQVMIGRTEKYDMAK
ncbi:hypothetical protein [Veronia pacifica]|uniref:Uncharacterized protein n=1 Tax=Veronia pacifica TaxID=1080227 RepID=A0A1C3ER34_9GAMM|nr:hypothetical protein [Veronia pacifica]ODA35711.1 hypothetical protein A8L45_03645 [Veronia pacifica]